MPQHLSRSAWQHCSSTGPQCGLRGCQLSASILPMFLTIGGIWEGGGWNHWGEPRGAKLLFLPCRQGLQVKVPVLAMLSVNEASSSSKEVKSYLEKSSHLRSCSFSHLLGQSQNTVLASRDLKSLPSPEQCFSVLCFSAFSWWKGS